VGDEQLDEGGVGRGWWGRETKASSSSSSLVRVCPSKVCTECESCFKEKKRKTKGPNPNICLVVDIGMRGRAHTRSTRGVAGANAGEEEEAAATLYVFFFFFFFLKDGKIDIFFFF
jgi:hypothetical protein